MTREIQAVVAVSGGTETHTDFGCPRDYWIQSVQIFEDQLYPFYVRLEFYYDDSDEYPEILFAGWFKATSGTNNINSIVINKKVYSERGILRACILNQSGTDLNPRIIVNFGPEATGQTSHYDRFVHQGIWAYDDMIERHTSAGVIDIAITPLAGSWIELYSIKVTAGMTGAEDITVEYHDENDETIETIIEDNTQTGSLFGPYKANYVSTAVATTPESIGKSEDVTRITYPDHIHILTSACPATDDLHIIIRARLKDAIPNITYGTNTQAQAAYTDDYNKVI